MPPSLVHTPNRLAFGERTVIVMSSKVAQKSYGTEKRFLCPPPTAIMIGNSWWSDVTRRGEEPKLCPPHVVVSISGEQAPQEGLIEWTSVTGKVFDVSDPPTRTTYIGRCVGKQLFISDVDEKKKTVEALVKIMAPSSDDEPERVIGTFPSRPIKVISKPSKKCQSAKNLQLCINHGSTISLFHRLRSQTVSTKYLCVSGSGSSFKVQMVHPSWVLISALALRHHRLSLVPRVGIRSSSARISSTASKCDPLHEQRVADSGLLQPDRGPAVLDHQTAIVGGGLQEGAKGIADHYYAQPVSQKGRRRPTSAGFAGSGSRRGSGSDSGASSGALWQVDIGETSVWTIVGTANFVVALDPATVVSFPSVGANSNTYVPSFPHASPSPEPMCGSKRRLNHGKKSVVVTVADAYPGCAIGSFDLTPTVFKKLAAVNVGRIHNGKGTLL
ncbi:hypothetical protein LXA43DRAFT_1148875 [Ganoderma leucocontextum]|nr:hypothetical protein LXA43DRAFT_1148875 [Ganoderma leucocontextum]